MVSERIMTVKTDFLPSMPQTGTYWCGIEGAIVEEVENKGTKYVLNFVCLKGDEASIGYTFPVYFCFYKTINKDLQDASLDRLHSVLSKAGILPPGEIKDSFYFQESNKRTIEEQCNKGEFCVGLNINVKLTKDGGREMAEIKQVFSEDEYEAAAKNFKIKGPAAAKTTPTTKWGQ